MPIMALEKKKTKQKKEEKKNEIYMPITERVEPRVYYINTEKMPLHTRA